MDNLPVHEVADVEEATIKPTGATLLFLPQYLPDR